MSQNRHGGERVDMSRMHPRGAGVAQSVERDAATLGLVVPSFLAFHHAR